MYTYMYVYIHVCIHTCMYTYIYLYIYIYVCVCVYIYICIYTHVYIYIYTYIHTYIHIIFPKEEKLIFILIQKSLYIVCMLCILLLTTGNKIRKCLQKLQTISLKNLTVQLLTRKYFKDIAPLKLKNRAESVAKNCL